MPATRTTHGSVTIVSDMDVTDATFESDVIERSQREPVVVDFWAEWCGPCKALGPVLEQQTAQKGVTLAKVDVDSNPELSQRFGISGIPAVKAFRNGNVVAEFVGAQPPSRVETFLDELTKPPVADRIDDPALKAALEAGDYERAFQLLLDRLDESPERKDEIRALMVELFAELGQEHPVATTYRRRLATALY
jgi:putative thioredoxin